MRRISFIKATSIVFGTAMLSQTNLKCISAQTLPDAPRDAYTANDRPPDARFKADILVVVAHPDDETMVTSYLARVIYEEHKRVAVVYGTRGDAGNNDVGPENALAMGQIREIEARQAVGSLGISNVWFLSGRDTASQNVLNSLEHWGHGACLDELVRIVRLTRPPVILTFLPDFTTGENHADHQAAGVLATEAFDLAGNPAAFPEQVSPVSNPDGNMNLTEGLRPWQPEKIYYFSNPTHDIFAGRGPHYSSSEVSPSQHMSYGMLAAKAFVNHRTQGGDRVQRAIDDRNLEKSQDEDTRLLTEPAKLIFGKSLVPSSRTDDVFAGVVPDGTAFSHLSHSDTAPLSQPALMIGDPWNFYHSFWKDHGLEDLATIVPTELTVKVGGSLNLPLIIENPLDTPIEVNVSVKAPDGWNVIPASSVSIGPHTRYFLRVRSAAPATRLAGWQNFTVAAQMGNRSIGTVSIRVELSTGWVAPL
jgi:LmbE family N-acetylglucosaminyl deacetylase